MHITIMCYEVKTENIYLKFEKFLTNLKPMCMKYGLYTKPVHVTIYFPM